MYKYNSRYFVFCFLLAVFFAAYLTLLPVDLFVDRDNYLRAATYPMYALEFNWGQGLLYYLVNEPFWAMTLFFLSNFFSPEDTIRVVIFYSSLSVWVLVFKNTRKEYFLFVLFILLLPQVLKNNIVHLRQGFAVSFFLWGWYSESGKFKYTLYLVASLIHASFMIVVPCFLLLSAVGGFGVPSSIRYFAYSVLGLFVGLYGIVIAGQVGARQAEAYSVSESNVSGLAFCYWIAVFSVYTIGNKEFAKKNDMLLFFILFYLSTYFFLPVTARIFESVLILILLASTGLNGYRKCVFLVLYAFYFLFGWGVRISDPGFGWSSVNYL